ncbi:MAG TPA: TAXI family TRAP transporter solute-binding subunit [Burkholderiaceae bacterium]|nr:TAXI family TRAP transporter solute-binding subunit [Burkholderiaceae bacterium]
MIAIIKARLVRVVDRLNDLFGRGVVLAVSLVLLVALAIALASFGLFDAAAPSTLSIASGPAGSSFQRTAERYQQILKNEGVTLKIVPTDGSRDNLSRLSNPKAEVDVGFVLGGETVGTTRENRDATSKPAENLMSLGSISYQPLMIFYRGEPKRLLSEFKGLRLDIGPDGSGASNLARTLLAANGIKAGDGTAYVDTAADDTVGALNEGRIDAFFAMSDSTPTALMRQLLRTPQVHLFNFTQADGYTRRISYLNKLLLPKGALDFGENIPAEDVQLIGPTVELIARESLHPALSDVLLEAAREVHGRPGLYRKRGEFPAPLEHEFRLSPDAIRYYASGKGFLYRTFPFWIASLIARVVAVLVPVILVLIPAMRIVPALYRWRMTSRIYRWYGALQRLERDALMADVDDGRRQELMRQLDQIERAVIRITVPAAFGDLFYGLRGHIASVRESLKSGSPLPTLPADAAAGPG